MQASLRPLTPRFRLAKGSVGASLAVRGSRRSGPCITSSRMAQSSTVRAKGPGVSRVGQSGSTPKVLIRPMLTLSPVMPHQDAGIRTEPPVSEPMAQGVQRAATATPDPDEDPPGVRWVFKSQGFQGVPIYWLVPQAP